MKRPEAGMTLNSTLPIEGWAGWLMGKLRASRRTQPQLRLVERIALAPRQSLALVEAEGRRFLVAIAAEGSPAFYALEDAGSGRMRPLARAGRARSSAARVSW